MGIEPKARIFKERNDYKNVASRLKGEAIPTAPAKTPNKATQ